MEFLNKKYNSLLVIELIRVDSKFRKFVLCKCDCGNEKVIHLAALVSGNTKSCGCLAKAVAKRRALPENNGAINQVILGYKRHARDRGFKWLLTRDQFIELASRDCCYCGSPPSNLKKGHSIDASYTYSGIDRIDPKKGYSIENCQSCCKVCNFAKSNLSLTKFEGWLDRLVAFRVNRP